MTDISDVHIRSGNDRCARQLPSIRLCVRGCDGGAAFPTTDMMRNDFVPVRNDAPRSAVKTVGTRKG